MEITDVIIVGGGISGIGNAQALSKYLPKKSFKILEARASIGGTWDLFRYPGVRSDSDMFTFSFACNPWKHSKVHLDGPSILTYLRDTASKFGIDKHIEYNSRVLSAAWSSEDKLWTLKVSRVVSDTQTEMIDYRCRFLQLCTGYYNYSEGYSPQFPGMETFRGRIVHPQEWPTSGPEKQTVIDFYRGKRVVVIGSGATAITLVPAMAKHAAHVTMLQRSPTYIVPMTAEDPLFNLLRMLRVPDSWTAYIIKWLTVFLRSIEYYFCMLFPGLVKKLLIKKLQSLVGPDVDVNKHFSPKYNPWEQRICACPDGDFMQVLKDKSASVVTGEIERFTPSGIVLKKTGEEVPADVVVTATGLLIQMHGGMSILMDGVPIDQRNMLSYKGLLLNRVPNLAFVMGYLTASWTLRSDMSAHYLCRLMKHMDEHGYKVFTPVYDDRKNPSDQLISFSSSFSSGYFKRSETGDQLYRTCLTRYPWKTNKWVLQDLWMLYTSPVDDDEMKFSR